MTSEEVLKSYTVAELKKEISKRNIKGYSKMKRAELHALIMKHRQHFSDLVKKDKPKKEKPKQAPKPKPKTKPTNKQPLPLGAAMKIKEHLVDKRDLTKRNIKVSDSAYFFNKVMNLLRKKDEYKYEIGTDKIKNLIEAIIRHDANAKKGEQLLMKEDTLGGKALGLVKRLTKYVKPSIDENIDEPLPYANMDGGNEAIVFLTNEPYNNWWYFSDRYFNEKERKKSVLIGKKFVTQLRDQLDTKANKTVGTPQYYDRLFARNKGKDILDMPAGILTYEKKPRLFK